MSEAPLSSMPQAHIDLVRNDWQNDEQFAVAKIFLIADGYGLIVKDTTDEHFEGNIYDTVGHSVRGTADEIVDVLQRSFRGPYLVASDLHDESECPFASGPLPISREVVKGRFVLPDLR